MSDGLLALNSLERKAAPLSGCSDTVRYRLKAALLRDGVPADQVEVNLSRLEAICSKFARSIGICRGSTLDYRGQRRLARFGMIISNFWFDATGAEPLDPSPSTSSDEADVNSICVYETIFEMVDEMVISLPSPQ